MTIALLYSYRLHQNTDEELGSCCLIYPIEVSFKKKMHAICIDEIQYILNEEIPFMDNRETHNVGLTLTKDINHNIYRFLMK